jgi:hypothetical protein
MQGLSLFAQLGKSRGDTLLNPEVIWGTAGLALALLAGALLVYMADRWRKKAAGRVLDPSEELTEFRGMYERGEITQDEYVKLRDRVAQRVKAPPPAPVAMPGSLPAMPEAGKMNPNTLPGPDQPTPPPNTGKPANPSSPA